MKRNVTAPFGRLVEQTEDRHSKSAFVASTRSQDSWLEPLSVTQEAAGSNPVAPAIVIAHFSKKDPFALLQPVGFYKFDLPLLL